MEDSQASIWLSGVKKNPFSSSGKYDGRSSSKWQN